MIKKIPNYNKKFELVHFLSDNVMDINEDGEVILTRGKQKNLEKPHKLHQNRGKQPIESSVKGSAELSEKAEHHVREGERIHRPWIFEDDADGSSKHNKEKGNQKTNLTCAKIFILF